MRTKHRRRDAEGDPEEMERLDIEQRRVEHDAHACAADLLVPWGPELHHQPEARMQALLHHCPSSVLVNSFTQDTGN